MATYVMSDLHGEMDRFLAMRKLIHFTDKDQLYVIGDVIDRYPAGVKILQMLEMGANTHLLLGNHEQMCLNTLGPHNEIGARDLWKSNGGSSTYREMVYHLNHTERNRLLRYLSSLPDSMEITVNGRIFQLVHGFPGKDKETRIWGRPNDCAIPIDDSKTTIIGHTPTCFLTNDFDHPYRIWYRDNLIDIDCGCGNTTNMRRLACLRLEDMAEFYV